MATTLPSPTSTTVDVSFPVTGMTCASCVNRVEKAIGKVAGVERAAVNLATERATVSYDPRQTTVADIAAAVERAGYGVADLPPEPVAAPVSRRHPHCRARTARWRRTPAGATEAVLPIEGMTCASCVRRVEKGLEKVPGRDRGQRQPRHGARHRCLRPGRRRPRHSAHRGRARGLPRGRGPSRRGVARCPTVGGTLRRAGDCRRAAGAGARPRDRRSQAQVAGQPGDRPGDDGRDVPAARVGHGDRRAAPADPGDGRPVLGRRRSSTRRPGRRPATAART